VAWEDETTMPLLTTRVHIRQSPPEPVSRPRATERLIGALQWGKPWQIPSSILMGILYAYPSRRFRCGWFGLKIHGMDGLFFLVIMLGLVFGLA